MNRRSLNIFTCTDFVIHGGDNSSLGHHALHPEGFLRVVKAEEVRLAKTQHTTWKTIEPLRSLSNCFD